MTNQTTTLLGREMDELVRGAQQRSEPAVADGDMWQAPVYPKAVWYGTGKAYLDGTSAGLRKARRSYRIAQGTFLAVGWTAAIALVLAAHRQPHALDRSGAIAAAFVVVLVSSGLASMFGRDSRSLLRTRASIAGSVDATAWRFHRMTGVLDLARERFEADPARKDELEEVLQSFESLFGPLIERPSGIKLEGEDELPPSSLVPEINAAYRSACLALVPGAADSSLRIDDTVRRACRPKGRAHQPLTASRLVLLLIMPVQLFIATAGMARGCSNEADDEYRQAPPASVVAVIDMPGEPTAVAVTETAVWVTNSDYYLEDNKDDDDTVVRVDPDGNEVTATITVGNDPQGVAATDHAIWVTNQEDATVSRIDPTTNQVVATVPVGAYPGAVTATENAVWVANRIEGTVTRIDPDTNAPIATVAVGSYRSGLAATDDAVWVISDGGTVSRIDPTTNAITASIRVGARPVAVAATDRAVWVANDRGRTVSRIDPATNEVTATIPLNAHPDAVTATDDAVWVANGLNGSVIRIDPDNNRVTRRIHYGSPVAVAATDTGVWVTNDVDGTVSHIDPNLR